MSRQGSSCSPGLEHKAAGTVKCTMMPLSDTKRYLEEDYLRGNTLGRMPTLAPGGHGAVGEWPRRPASVEPYVSSGSSGIRGAVGRPSEEPQGGLREKLDFDHLFSGFRLDLEDTWSPIISRPASASPPSLSPITLSPPISSSPIIPSSTLNGSPLSPAFFSPPAAVQLKALPEDGVHEEDPAFKNDLAHVLVWFGDDLTSQQKLTTVYTLMQKLSPTQLTLLWECLKPENHADPTAVKSNGTWRRPHSQNAPLVPRPVRASPFPTSLTDNGDSSRSSSPPLCGVSAVEIPQLNLALFEEDYSAWLRFHRLHKYQETFQSMQHDRQAILRLDDAALERVGVAALGARRKFLRLFEMIRSARMTGS